MRLKSDFILLLVAAVWGGGFVAQRVAATHGLSAFTFNGGRFLLGGLLLLPLVRFRLNIPRRLLPWVGLLGVLLFAGSTLQQAGLASTTVGNAGFITGLYVVIVPLILSLFLREKLGWASWTAALLAVAGIFLLSVTADAKSISEFRFAPGDILELGGAFFWALHVILIGRLAQRMDVLQFTIVQFLICGALSLVLGVALNPSSVSGFALAWQALLYSVLFSVMIGYTLQGVGQKHAPATDSAIILSMEAVFGALFGYLLLGELLIPRQILGCVLILAAMLLAQLKAGLDGKRAPGEKRTPALDS